MRLMKHEYEEDLEQWRKEAFRRMLLSLDSKLYTLLLILLQSRRHSMSTARWMKVLMGTPAKKGAIEIDLILRANSSRRRVIGQPRRTLFYRMQFKNTKLKIGRKLLKIWMEGLMCSAFIDGKRSLTPVWLKVPGHQKRTSWSYSL